MSKELLLWSSPSEIIINNLELFNVLGKQVFSQKVEAKQANISVAHLSKGIYIAKVTIGNSTGSYKFIKE